MSERVVYRAWGYIPDAVQRAESPGWRSDLSGRLQSSSNTSVLPFGNGRSYGDSCLSSMGVLIHSQQLDRFISFNADTGELVAESGVSLSSILSLVVPKGWFLPVSPGTSFVTLGGAVANDVHGKNHHCDGTIGRHISSFDLVRSSGEELTCSRTSNAELFSATIGGLGLTGFVTTITVQLIPIKSSQMNVRVDVFNGLQEFAALSTARMSDYQYTVAWLDCVASGPRFARGIFLSANHSDAGALEAAAQKTKVSIPLALPAWALNARSVGAFNSVYFSRLARRDKQQFNQHYQPYFYPLDAVGHWNRIYGSKGFYQYQFVVPVEAIDTLDAMLRKIVDSGMGSFLAVLKEFGDIESPGMLSFPRKGFCLALDFANRGARTVALINALDEQVMACGGAAYPAKDRLMSADAFAQYFPRMNEFKAHIDPNFSSDFWERVSG